MEDKIPLICIVLFTILTAVLLAGKGVGLIAGYNTSSNDEQKKYNRKKLCRVVGGCFGILDVLMILSWITQNNPITLLTQLTPWVIGADIIITMILANTICRIRE